MMKQCCWLFLVLTFVLSCREDASWRQAESIVAGIEVPAFPDAEFRITDYGAVPDALTDALPSIRQALRLCSDAGGGHVVIPSGKWFCKGPVHLLSHVDLHFEDGAELVFSTDPADYLPCVLTRWEGTEVFNYSPLIYAWGVHHVAITGKGVLNGQGKLGFEAWKALQKADQRELRRMGREQVPVHERVFGEGHYLRPAMMDLVFCHSVLIEDVKIVDGTFWSFHLVGCSDATVRRVSVDCTNLNSDGVDPESCRNVLIEDCCFHTGDDCIALKSGRDQDGWRLGQPTENVVIRRCTFNTDSNGICIGSEVSGGIRNVFVSDCHIVRSKQGLYFKSNQDRGAYMERVYVRDIQVDTVLANLIKFEPAYKNEGSQYYPTAMRHFSIRGVRARHAGECGIYLAGFPDLPVEDVYIGDLVLEDTPEPVKLSHYRDLTLDRVVINGTMVTAPFDCH